MLYFDFSEFQLDTVRHASKEKLAHIIKLHKSYTGHSEQKRAFPFGLKTLEIKYIHFLGSHKLKTVCSLKICFTLCINVSNAFLCNNF